MKTVFTEVEGIMMKTVFVEVRTQKGEICLVNTDQIKMVLSDVEHDTWRIRLTDGTLLEGFNTDQKDKLFELFDVVKLYNEEKK